MTILFLFGSNCRRGTWCPASRTMTAPTAASHRCSHWASRCSLSPRSCFPGSRCRLPPASLDPCSSALRGRQPP
uniref:Uncharacterized protein n=1 Tax=Anguilla anguilla TaxID=7936 RepID=A0A0E9QST6_ANGAN